MHPLDGAWIWLRLEAGKAKTEPAEFIAVVKHVNIPITSENMRIAQHV